MENRLPVIYLVDSAGVFLPMQDEIFPDEDDFGRIFRNNALFSAAGIPQFAAIMGMILHKIITPNMVWILRSMTYTRAIC